MQNPFCALVARKSKGFAKLQFLRRQLATLAVFSKIQLGMTLVEQIHRIGELTPAPGQRESS